MSTLAPLQEFQWSRQPEAEAFLRSMLDDFVAHCDFAAALGKRMTLESGSRLFDWIDSFTLPPSAAIINQFPTLGFELDSSGAYRNSHGMFPRVRLTGQHKRLAIKVDSVADFLAVQHLDLAILGDPFAPLRIATVARQNDYRLDVVERRGSPNFTIDAADPKTLIAAATHLEQFRKRNRHFTTTDAGFQYANTLIDSAIEDLGVDQTCALFFAAEREYWQSRNRAAQVQYARQNRLGLGWGNHDHHTYRSSRASFAALIALHEKLGLVCRERFYAGREAGWGAQVMENPRAGIITFNDVDLSPEELVADFAHNPLPPRPALGTVGLWCGLHGEASLEAGMHHLECQFDFDALREQLAREHNINTMKPFTDFTFLRQAFTEGERWPVAEDKLASLLAANLITPAQSEKFRKEGALGSHLENLERNEGYKGFNQKGVSEIISATDPRLHQNG